MRRTTLALSVVAVAALFVGSALADDYDLDPVHSSVTFKIGHLGISWVHGRFNKVGGDFTVDGNNSSFALTIKADSVDSANPTRDGHLRSPDFFNVKQFPLISFKSTSAKATDSGYDVAGDLTMHGMTKPVTLKLVGGKTAEFKGITHIGLTTVLTLKRSDFGMDKMIGPLSDEVRIDISFEGVKKK